MPNSNAIDAPEADYLFIKNSQIPSSGKGLFTSIPIYKDEIIALFKGEILSEIQIQNRLKKSKDRYFIRMLDGTIMDSYKTKCFAKYANDATAYSNPIFKNCSKITIDENNNVALVATRNIKINEEIFCSYGKAYWKKHG